MPGVDDAEGYVLADLQGVAVTFSRAERPCEAVSPEAIVGAAVDSPDELLWNYRQAWEDTLFAIGRQYHGLSPRALSDGVDEAECAALRALNATVRQFVSFDVRETKPSKALLDQVFACAALTLIFDEPWWELFEKPDDLPALGYAFIQDDSATTVSDCGAVLGAEPIRRPCWRV